MNMQILRSKLLVTYTTRYHTNIKKTEQSCIELTVNNAQTIENQMKIRNNNFLIAAVDFSKVNISAANQNKLIFILNYLIRLWTYS